MSASKRAEQFKGIVRDIAAMAPAAVELQNEQAEADDQETPEALYLPLDDEFEFTLDVAASVLNAKCTRFCTQLGYYDESGRVLDHDGLRFSWAGERVWCNPPYTLVRPWVERAWEQQNELTVMLLPNNRSEQAFWQDLVEPYRDRAGSILTTRNLRKRRAFGARVNGELVFRKSPPFGLVLLIWDRRRPAFPVFPNKTPNRPATNAEA